MQENALRSKLIGAILLVAGTTIGAAMLALPVASGRSGLGLSLLAIGGGWLFMYVAALILLEVCLIHPKDSNVVTLSFEMLGKKGALFAVGSYLFLLYALITAYLAALSGILGQLGSSILPFEVPQLVYCIPLILFFAGLFVFGIQALDRLNRLLMLGLIVGFILLLAAALPTLDTGKLTETRTGYFLDSLPIVVTAFGFHVIIPSLVTYLERNKKLIKQALFWGSVLPLVAYCLWQIACLGSVPLIGDGGLDWGYEHGVNGASLLASQTKIPLIAVGADLFSLCAILTSFLGVSLSLFDFLKDGLRQFPWAKSKPLLLAVTFLPPLIFVLSNPRAFFIALDLAGTYGVVVLLALLPGVMLWIKRFRLSDGRYTCLHITKKGLVLFLLICALFIIVEACLQIGIV